MSRVNHPGTRERESGASGAKSLEDRHNRVRCENRKSAVGEDGANFEAWITRYGSAWFGRVKRSRVRHGLRGTAGPG